MSHNQANSCWHLSEVPQEILSLFIYHSRHNLDVLLVLCLVSRRFLHDSRRFLYRNIAISDNDSSIPPGFPWYKLKKGRQLFTVFTDSNPPLARHVHTLYLDFFPRGREVVFQEYFLPLIRSGLGLLVNLKILSITGPLSLTDDPSIGLLFNQCTFQLETFRYWSSPSSELYTSSIAAFLPTQHQIKNLAILWRLGTPFVDAYRPRLEQLTGDTPTVQSILPNVPSVTRLVWIPSDEGALALSSPIIRRLANLHTFSIRAPRSSRMIQPLVPYLESLRVLHLTGTSVITFFEDNLNFVAKLPNLRIFIHSLRKKNNIQWGNHSYSREKMIGNRELLVKEWFKVLPYLQVTYFQLLELPPKPRRFLAWKRDIAKPMEFEGDEVWDISPWA